MKRKCRKCKKEFVTDNNQQFYCSQKCRNDYNYKERKENKKPKNMGFFDWNDYKSSIF